MPEPALPTIMIFAVPGSLCLAGYMNSFTEKDLNMIIVLRIISITMYLVALYNMPRLLKISFSPSYSAFTFPMVISAIALKLTNNYLKGINNELFLKTVVKFQEGLAGAIVIYILFKFSTFVFSKKQLPNVHKMK